MPAWSYERYNQISYQFGKCLPAYQAADNASVESPPAVECSARAPLSLSRYPAAAAAAAALAMATVMASLASPPNFSCNFKFSTVSSSSFYSPSSLRFRFPAGNARRPPLWNAVHRFPVRAQILDFSGSFFEDGDDDDESSTSDGIPLFDIEEKEEMPWPPGLRKYETMAVLRPEMSEEERLNLTQKYEELLIAGGGMYVEVFNRGVIPLAYPIKRKNRDGETNTYLDGIYLLFIYFTKPESMAPLEARLKTDDDVIRSSSFKIRKRRNPDPADPADPAASI
ncbi:hypothetical protein ACLOJK_010311 [Asimina triloba]